MGTFISYSRDDQVAVKALADVLGAARRELWFDHDLTGGDVWWPTILANIRSCSVFLFALSDNSWDSVACRAELCYAEALRRPIVPVLVGTVSALQANPLSRRQIVFFNPNEAVAGAALVGAVDAAARRKVPLPDPLPDEPQIPYAYLLGLNDQIDDAAALNPDGQLGLTAQLGRALHDETDPSVRQTVVEMLRRLSRKASDDRVQREIRFMLDAAGFTAEASGRTQPTPLPAPERHAPEPPREVHSDVDVDAEHEARAREAFLVAMEERRRERLASAPAPGWVGSRNDEPSAGDVRPAWPGVQGGSHGWPDLGTELPGGASGDGEPAGETAPRRSPAVPSFNGVGSAGPATTHFWTDDESAATAPPAEQTTERETEQTTEQLPVPDVAAAESDDPTARYPTPSANPPTPPTRRALGGASLVLSLVLAGIVANAGRIPVALAFALPAAFALVSLGSSAQVPKRVAAGDDPAARRASRVATTWGVVAAVVAVVIGVLALIATGQP